jgi:cell division protein FtsB
MKKEEETRLLKDSRKNLVAEIKRLQTRLYVVEFDREKANDGVKWREEKITKLSTENGMLEKEIKNIKIQVFDRTFARNRCPLRCLMG